MRRIALAILAFIPFAASAQSAIDPADCCGYSPFHAVFLLAGALTGAYLAAVTILCAMSFFRNESASDKTETMKDVHVLLVGMAVCISLFLATATAIFPISR